MTDQVEVYPVYWKGQLVGTITELGPLDMWYFDAEWHSADTQQAAGFTSAISHLVGKTFFNATEEQLVWVEISELNMNCTVVHVPIENRITFRIMIHMKPPKSD